MVGVLYLLGTVFGIASTVAGGEVISSIVKMKPLSDRVVLDVVVANPSQLIFGSFFILLMGISLVAMTVYLYPIFKKDSEELSLGMLLFRGALEGTWYFITTISILFLFTLGNEYSRQTGQQSISILSMINNASLMVYFLLSSLDNLKCFLRKLM